MSSDTRSAKFWAKPAFSPIACSVRAAISSAFPTGAVMLLPLLDMTLNVYRGTHTFDGLGMTAYEPLGGI